MTDIKTRLVEESPRACLSMVLPPSEPCIWSVEREAGFHRNMPLSMSSSSVDNASRSRADRGVIAKPWCADGPEEADI